MKTYLFAWNQKLFPWPEHSDAIKQLRKKGKANIKWSCGNTQVIAPGDRIFLIKIGSSPKGIVASGYVTRAPFYAAHWQDPTRQTLFVEAELDCLFDPVSEPLLGLDVLTSGTLADQRWTTQSSGISIKQHLVDELEAVWYNFLVKAKNGPTGFFAEAAQAAAFLWEGSANQVTVTKYERNPHARKACLQHYGYGCVVCQFDFEQRYGPLGKEFIHVHHHHLTQLARVGQQYAIDPIKDLRPVCANCHAMLHRTKAGLSIADLQARLTQAADSI